MTEEREETASPDGYRYRVRDAFRALRRKPPPLGSDAAPPVPGKVADEESITWMLVPAEAHLTTQRTQLDSLIARAIQLAGFSAVLLGLLAAFVSNRLDEVDGYAEILAKGAFVSTLVLAQQVGRDARTGEFITVAEASRHKATAVVETVPMCRKKKL